MRVGKVLAWTVAGAAVAGSVVVLAPFVVPTVTGWLGTALGTKLGLAEAGGLIAGAAETLKDGVKRIAKESANLAKQNPAVTHTAVTIVGGAAGATIAYNAAKAEAEESIKKAIAEVSLENEDKLHAQAREFFGQLEARNGEISTLESQRNDAFALLNKFTDFIRDKHDEVDSETRECYQRLKDFLEQAA